MQSLGVWSLNHDLTTTLGLSHVPIFPKSTASQGAKILCIHPIWMWDAVNGGLQPQP